MKTTLLRLSCLLLAALPPPLAGAAATPDIKSEGFTQADFFQPNRVWTVHLSLTPQQWQAMQPTVAPNAARGAGAPMVNAEGLRNGLAAVQGVNFEYAHADLEIDGRAFKDVGVRYKGNGSYLASRGGDKISLKVDLNKYVKGQKLAGLSTINFHNSIRDTGFMTEMLAYRFYRDAGAIAPRVTYARVHVTVPGRHDRKYLGLYTVIENVDSNLVQDRLGNADGAIFKPNNPMMFEYLGDTWSLYNQRYDPKTDLTDADRQWMMDFLRFANRSTPAEFSARIGDYVDLKEFAAYFAAMVWMVNMDTVLMTGQNYYLYLPNAAPRKLVIVPWDQDESWGQVSANSALNIHRPWIREVPFLDRLFGAEAFRKLYYDKLVELALTIGNSSRIAAQVDALAPVLRPALQDESPTLLNLFNQAADGGMILRTTGNRNQVPSIKAFSAAREQAVIGQLLAK